MITCKRNRQSHHQKKGRTTKEKHTKTTQNHLPETPSSPTHQNTPGVPTGGVRKDISGALGPTIRVTVTVTVASGVHADALSDALLPQYSVSVVSPSSVELPKVEAAADADAEPTLNALPPADDDDDGNAESANV